MTPKSRNTRTSWAAGLRSRALSVDLVAGGEDAAVHGAHEIERLQHASLHAEPHEEVVHHRESRVRLADAPPGIDRRPHPEAEGEGQHCPPQRLLAQQSVP